ncbi:MAG: hypothetical protein FJ405_02725 [Verrucomicrobia bacterium]|nr:hypothetical protein [Verrucomicrobiota bacterium]
MNPFLSAAVTPLLRVRAGLSLWSLLIGALAAGAIHLHSTARAEEFWNAGPIPAIEIEIDEPNLEILGSYQWKWGGNHQERKDATCIVREAGKVYTNVQIHLKGAAGSFRPVDDRPAMTLNFSKRAKGQKFHGLEKLSLNNSVQDSTLMQEILAREVFNAAGVPTTRATHATVKLNGRSLGNYVLVEGWNKPFLKRHFKDATGNLYDGGFGQDIDRPLEINSGDSADARSRLKELVQACAIPDRAARAEALNRLVDLDRFLTFAALEMMFTHMDGYCIGHNNYRVYDDPSSQRFVFMPHGMDQLFGQFKSTTESSLTPGFKSKAARGILGLRGMRQQYLARVATLYTNHFDAARLNQRVDELAARLRPALDGGASRRILWEAAVARLKMRIQKRCESIQSQLVKPPEWLAIAVGERRRLGEWRFQPDTTGSGQGAQQTQDGIPCMTLVGPETKPRVWPSWRKTVSLDRGTYSLNVRVRVESSEGSEGDPVPCVVLRMSGVRDGFRRTVSPTWTELSYPVEIDEPSEIELVCELRGTKSKTWIEVNSFTLSRTAGP